ncbi:DUF6571 family protein [Streptomyces tubercidicus]|uniref:DUF6571 family protein n=1 Tax=Streptomyces tubercidicus TaxID=47759 RepID=UPI0030E0677A
MVTFSDLLHADLGKLQAAADEWKLLPKKYQGLQELFEARVTKPLKSDWKGDAAEQAQVPLAKIKKQYQAAAEEAQAITTLLSDAHAEFSSAQKNLRRIIDEEAPSDKLVVTEIGTVEEADLDKLAVPIQARDLEFPERKAAIDAMQKRIAKVLRDATAADEAAEWALSQDSNGKNNASFNKNIYTSLEAARGAQKDMSEALRLAKKSGEDLSNDELARLGSILAKRKNDMVFAEKFAISMGPKGALEFWREASGPASGERGAERNAALKELQSGLGATIGMATQSDSVAMDGWKEKMLALGPETIDPGGDGGPSARGYQLMSSLLRGGGYDTDFLHDYGRGLVSFERSHKTLTPQMLWAPDSVMARVDYSGEGGGSDPMKGLMDALAKNPEAATSFLDPGVNNEDDRLKYLAGEREWPKDPFDGKAGHHSLALAIEAGATGPGGESEFGSRGHTEPQTRVMRDAINALGGETPPENRKDDDEIRPYKPLLSDMRGPIANVLRDYVPETHDALSGTKVQAAVPLDPGALTRTIRGVAEDPDAFRALHEAETKHVAQELAKHQTDASLKAVNGFRGDAAHAMAAYDAVQADVILDHKESETAAKAWQVKAAQHTLSAGATKIPGIGDIAVRLIDVGAKAWQDSATTDIKINADGEIEANARAGSKSVNEMVANWYTARGLSPDSGEAHDDQHQADNTYETGLSTAGRSLGRGNN